LVNIATSTPVWFWFTDREDSLPDLFFQKTIQALAQYHQALEKK
jgi:hypothetical protein